MIFQFKLGGGYSRLNSLYSLVLVPESQFMVGYKLNRIVLGLGFEFSRFTVESGGDTAAMNSLAFIPTFQVHMVEKGPVGLYATTGLHVGTSFGDGPGGGYYYSGDSSKATLVGFHLGLGLRCFLHRRFGFGIEGGFRGIWHLTKTEDSYYGDDENTTGQSSFYGAVTFFALL